MTKGLCKSAKERHLFTQNWLIQRHSSGIMGIISPTLCHKCMQHASEWQEQWPLSVPSPGWRWGGASWEADRQTGSYSEVQILEGGLTRTQATSNGTPTSRYGPCVNDVLGLPLLCTKHSACIRGQAVHTSYNYWLDVRKNKDGLLSTKHIFICSALFQDTVTSWMNSLLWQFS